MPSQTLEQPDRQGRSLAPVTARQLEVGEKMSIDVVARRYWNDTGLHVTAGQRYRLTAHGHWIDFDLPCRADGPGAAVVAKRAPGPAGTYERRATPGTGGRLVRPRRRVRAGEERSTS